MAVAHYANRGPSLTTVGWQSSQASDGLRIPGRTHGSGDDYEVGNIEALWRAAYPPGVLHRRIAYGLYGVAPNGYWAVICASQRHVDLLQAHGTDARAAGALTWPFLAVGLTRSELVARWPALTQVAGPHDTRHAIEVPLYTPTALVHRLVAVGIAPITPMTANLTLISRQSMVFDGVPWFAFHRDSDSDATVVAEVTAAGEARRLGLYPAVHDSIVERCWGVTTRIVEQRHRFNVVVPGSFEQLPRRGATLRDNLTRLGPSIDGARLAALDVETVLNGDTDTVNVRRTPAAAHRLLAVMVSATDGSEIGRVDPGAQLLLKPPNGVAPREPRLGGSRTRATSEPAQTDFAREAG